MAWGDYTDPGDPGAPQHPTREILREDRVSQMTKISDGLTLYPELIHYCDVMAGPRTVHRNRSSLGRMEVSAGWEGEGGRPSGQHQGQGLEAMKMLTAHDPHAAQPEGAPFTL